MVGRTQDTLVILALLASATACAAAVGCRDASNKEVDWWIALKAPEGSRYGYIDSKQNTPRFEEILEDELANLDGNPLANTVQQMYPDSNNQRAASYVTWNDQPYGTSGKPRVSEFHAHAKGVIGYESNQGFWLVHSNPKFPDNPSKAAYSGIGNCTASGKCGPNYGQQKFAQSYLCITMDGEMLEKVAQALQIAHLVIADHNTASDKNQYPEIHRLATHKYPATQVPDKVNISQPVTSIGGEQFIQFEMSPTELGDDVYLYEQLVEPVLQSGLLVETWIEPPVFPSYCLATPASLPDPLPNPPFEYDTYVVRDVKISKELKWSNPHTKNEGDHSKWAVTFLPPPPPHANADQDAKATSRKLLADLSTSAGVTAGRRADGYPKSVCIGDINRAGHQLQRGGGTVCFVANDALWETFSGIVETWDDC